MFMMEAQNIHVQTALFALFTNSIMRLQQI